MKGSKVWGGRIGFVVVMGLSASAWADEAPNTQAPVAPTLSKKAQADALYDEGMEAAALKRWEAAAEAFKKSDELEPSINTIAQWGRVLVLDEKYVEGATKLQRFLREAKDAPEGLTKAVQGLLRDAKRKVATVQVKIEPADAVLIIDDIKVDADEASGPIYLEPRAHTFSAEKKGFVMTPVSKTYAAGADVTMDLKMEVAPEGDAGAQGGPGGAPAGPGPIGTIRENRPMPMNLKLAWASTGIFGAIAFGTGIAAAARYPATVADLKMTSHCMPNCATNYDDKARTLAALTWTAAVSGVVTGISLGYALKHRNESNDRRKNGAFVRIGPTFGGIVVNGAW